MPSRSTPTPTRRFRAAIALYPGMLSSSVTLPLEILAAAQQRARSEGSAALDVCLAADTLDPVHSGPGLTLSPTRSWSQLEHYDLVVLPAIWRNPLRTVRATPMLRQFLPQLWHSGTALCAVGTASYLLAECGLLEGRPATTHWYFFDEFRSRYPQVLLKTRHLVTHSDRLYCAGSVNAMTDLTLHFVEQWLGAPVARHVESQFSPEARKAFAGNAFLAGTERDHHDELVRDAQVLLQDQLRDPPDLAALAQHLGSSPRSLFRRFRKATDMTPGAYLRAQRLRHARDLLQRSNLSISEVAWQVGINDVSYFSRMFRSAYGLPPAQFRRSVRGKLFSTHQQH